jgi:hypothetical protein
MIMATNSVNCDDAPELLYHVKRTIIDFSHDSLMNSSGATEATDILVTYTDVSSAKAAARSALRNEGYLEDDFEEYEENDERRTWAHGDGVIVFARAPAGQVFEVRLDTKANAFKLKGAASTNEIQGHLHYGKYLQPSRKIVMY